MEPRGCTGGNHWQIECLSKPAIQARSVATGCHQLPKTFFALHESGQLPAVAARIVRHPADVHDPVHGPVDDLRSPLVVGQVQRREGGAALFRLCKADRARRTSGATRSSVAAAALTAAKDEECPSELRTWAVGTVAIRSGVETDGPACRSSERQARPPVHSAPDEVKAVFFGGVRTRSCISRSRVRSLGHRRGFSPTGARQTSRSLSTSRTVLIR